MAVLGLAAFAAAAFLPTSTQAGLPVTLAYDNADLSNYSPQPNHGWASINGGYGYNLWTPLGGVGGGGSYMEGVGVNGRQVDGNYSFALFAGSGSYAISRPLTNAIAAGEFDITTRFDLAGNGPNLFNLRSGNNTAGFGSGELLSFGIVGSLDPSQLSYTDGSGLHLISSGEARGAIWLWNVDFNAAAGTYSLSVTNVSVSGGFATSFSGNLELSSTTVGSFGAINSGTGNNQNLIFDSPTFSVVPEPSALSLVLLGLAAAALARRRRRTS